MFIRYQMIGTQRPFPGELGIACENCMQIVEKCFLICLLQRTLQPNNQIINDLATRLGQPYEQYEQYSKIYNSVEVLIGGLPEPVLAPILEAQLSNLINELSTKYVDIGKLVNGKPESLEKVLSSEAETESEEEPQNIPTIEQVKASYSHKDIPWDSFASQLSQFKNSCAA